MSSDFTAGSPMSAQWGYTDGSFSNVCATQGRSFLNVLRTQLGLAPGPWDDALQSQLIARVNGFVVSEPGWQIVSDELQRDAAARSVGEMSLRAGLFFAYYANQTDRRFDAIQILSDTIPPQWDQLPADDRNANSGQVACIDPRVDQTFALLSSEEIAQATQDSRTGIRLGAGRSGPSSVVEYEQVGPKTVSALTVFLISVLLVGVGIAVSRSGKVSRRKV